MQPHKEIPHPLKYFICSTNVTLTFSINMLTVKLWCCSLRKSVTTSCIFLYSYIEFVVRFGCKHPQAEPHDGSLQTLQCWYSFSQMFHSYNICSVRCWRRRSTSYRFSCQVQMITSFCDTTKLLKHLNRYTSNRSIFQWIVIVSMAIPRSWHTRCGIACIHALTQQSCAWQVCQHKLVA